MSITPRIESGKTLTDVARLLSHYKNIYVINDRIFDNVIWELLVSSMSIGAGMDMKTNLSLEGGEKVKSLGTVEKIALWLTAHGAGRDTTLVIIGGGTICDVGAYTASIYKRGVPFVLIPTTLLSQVDAAIGGKTAINLGGIKNVLGSFCWPEFTYICPDLLKTLPKEEIINGAAEMLKTSILSGQNFEKTIEALKTGQPLDDLIMEAARYKASIVEQDPYDKDIRQTLNLGHTFGHAIESVTGLGHGKSVAIGIVMAAKIAEEKELAPRGFASFLAYNFKAVGLPTECPLPIEDLEEKIIQDKKAQADGEISFILPCGIGKIEKVKMSVKEAIDLLK